MAVLRFDHVGIVVRDLEAARAFFALLGLEAQDEMDMAGDWIGDVIGLTDVRSRIVAMQVPGGQTWIELTCFTHPTDGPDAGPLPPHAPGIRHVCFAVDDLDATLERLHDGGYATIGAVVEWEQTYRLCYVRGPEGIIVELAESVG